MKTPRIRISHVRALLQLIIISGVCGCTHRSAYAVDDYLSWLNDPANGLCKTKHIGGLQIRVKWLSTDYLEYLDKRDESEGFSSDSRKDTHSNKVVFLLSIAPDEQDVGSRTNVVTSGVKTYNEFTQRVIDMNFNMADYVQLATERGNYKPVLATSEGTYGLGTDQNVVLVFASDTDMLVDESSVFDLTFSDTLFDTGISHFVFTKQDFQESPPLRF